MRCRYFDQHTTVYITCLFANHFVCLREIFVFKFWVLILIIDRQFGFSLLGHIKCSTSGRRTELSAGLLYIQ